ncbi:MAG: MATE family efflux transporter [Desulfobulbus propionicus]|nr:MAG: MATE family efflux transporter [Desulfobulbus propionicus]
MTRARILYLHESGRLLGLTLPLLLAQVFQTAMGVVDTVMAGRYSALDLAGVAVGSSLFFPLYLFMVGVLGAVPPLVAQADGRGDTAAIGRVVRQGMLIGLLLGTIMLLVVRESSRVLVLMGVSPEVLPVTVGYLRAIAWGMPVVGLFLALRGTCEGVSLPKMTTVAGLIGLMVNMGMNAVLIYGRFGLPELGGVGCGYATALSMLVMLLVLVVLLQWNRRTRRLEIFCPEIRHLCIGLTKPLRLGLPIGLALFIECSIFSVIALFIARLGAEVVAAHQIALNFASLVFMLPYSLAAALTVRVGFAAGRQRPERLRRTVRVGLWLAAGCACCTALIYFTSAPLIAAMYSPDPAVAGLATSLLLFAGLFQLPDAIQVNCAGALRGLNDTRVPMLLLIFAYWGIGLPVGWILGISGFWGLPQGPQGFWVGLISGLSVAALLLSWRLRWQLRHLSGSR